MLKLNIDKTLWRFSDEMSMASLSDQWKILQQQYPLNQTEWTLDFNQVTRSDSAALAFLIACLRHAKKNAIPLRLQGMSDDFMRLMAVQGLTDIFKEIIIL